MIKAICKCGVKFEAKEVRQINALLKAHACSYTYAEPIWVWDPWRYDRFRRWDYPNVTWVSGTSDKVEHGTISDMDTKGTFIQCNAAV